MRMLRKEGENGNPNMSSVRIYGKIMSTIRKRHKRLEKAGTVQHREMMIQEILCYKQNYKLKRAQWRDGDWNFVNKEWDWETMEEMVHLGGGNGVLSFPLWPVSPKIILASRRSSDINSEDNLWSLCWWLVLLVFQWDKRKLQALWVQVHGMLLSFSRLY